MNWAAAPDPPDRSRERALELAQEVARLAQATPTEFSELAERYSEDITTREEGGSLGGIGASTLRSSSRTTHASRPKPPAPLLEWCGALQGIADELRREPSRFEVYQRELCCTGTDTWQEGQGSVLQELSLAPLQIGGIASAPTRLEGKRYALIKRVAPGAWSPEPVLFDLPAPARPSLEQFVAYAPASQIAARGQATARDLALESDVAQRLVAAHDVEQRFASIRSRKGRWRVFSNVQQQVERLLGPQHFADYTASADRFVEHELLHSARTSPSRMAVPQIAR